MRCFTSRFALSIAISRGKKISSRLNCGARVEGDIVSRTFSLRIVETCAELVGTQSSFDIAQVSFEEGEYKKKTSRS